MSVWSYAPEIHFFRLSFFLRSPDQFQASHWSSLPLSLIPFEKKIQFLSAIRKQPRNKQTNKQKMEYKNCIATTICIRQEIQCLPYVVFSESAFDQRSLIHREAWFMGGPRIPQNQLVYLPG